MSSVIDEVSWSTILGLPGHKSPYATIFTSVCLLPLLSIFVLFLFNRRRPLIYFLFYPSIRYSPSPFFLIVILHHISLFLSRMSSSYLRIERAPRLVGSPDHIAVQLNGVVLLFWISSTNELHSFSG